MPKINNLYAKVVNKIKGSNNIDATDGINTISINKNKIINAKITTPINYCQFIETQKINNKFINAVFNDYGNQDINTNINNYKDVAELTKNG